MSYYVTVAGYDSCGTGLAIYSGNPFDTKAEVVKFINEDYAGTVESMFTDTTGIKTELNLTEDDIKDCAEWDTPEENEDYWIKWKVFEI